MFAMRKIKQILFVQRGEGDGKGERVKGGKREVVRKTTQSLQSLRATHTHTVLKSVNGPTTRTTLERSNSNSATAQQQQLLEWCLPLLLQLLPVLLLLLLLQLPFVHPSRLKRHMAFLQNSNKTVMRHVMRHAACGTQAGNGPPTPLPTTPESFEARVMRATWHLCR